MYLEKFDFHSKNTPDISANQQLHRRSVPNCNVLSYYNVFKLDLFTAVKISIAYSHRHKKLQSAKSIFYVCCRVLSEYRILLICAVEAR